MLREIISRHRSSLKGVLRACFVSSRALGIRKPFYVYEPPGLEAMSNVPVLYLFRGHEREWVNINEDSSRQTTTAVEEVDEAISIGLIPPVLLVMPGLNSANNHVPSLGINMMGTWPATFTGLGSGQFWTFLTEELPAEVRSRYPQIGGVQMAAGFSLGGYTASLLAIFRPGSFRHVGIYDGLFTWPEYRDPRVVPVEAGNDNVWMKGRIFDAAFGNPRNESALARWNPTDRLLRAGAGELNALRKTTWWISCAASDGQLGNRDRGEYYQRLLKSKHIPVGFKKVVFAPEATHNWHWTDKFLLTFLTRSLT